MKTIEQIKREVKAITTHPAYAVVPLEDVNVLLDYINRLESEVGRLMLQAEVA